MDRIGLICRYIKEDPRSTQRDLGTENRVFRGNGEYLN